MLSILTSYSFWSPPTIQFFSLFRHHATLITNQDQHKRNKNIKIGSFRRTYWYIQQQLQCCDLNVLKLITSLTVINALYKRTDIGYNLIQKSFSESKTLLVLWPGGLLFGKKINIPFQYCQLLFVSLESKNYRVLKSKYTCWSLTLYIYTHVLLLMNLIPQLRIVPN